MKISRRDSLPPIIQNPDGEDIQEILGVQAGDVQSHSLAQITIRPGNSSQPHYHKNTEESYLILSGKGDLIVEERHFQLAAGEAVLIEPNEVHQILNYGPDALVFLAVCVPAWHSDDSYDSGVN